MAGNGRIAAIKPFWLQIVIHSHTCVNISAYCLYNIYIYVYWINVHNQNISTVIQTRVFYIYTVYRIYIYMYVIYIYIISYIRTDVYIYWYMYIYICIYAYVYIIQKYMYIYIYTSYSDCSDSSTGQWERSQQLVELCLQTGRPGAAKWHGVRGGHCDRGYMVPPNHSF